MPRHSRNAPEVQLPVAGAEWERAPLADLRNAGRDPRRGHWQACRPCPSAGAQAAGPSNLLEEPQRAVRGVCPACDRNVYSTDEGRIREAGRYYHLQCSKGVCVWPVQRYSVQPPRALARRGCALPYAVPRVIRPTNIQLSPRSQCGLARRQPPWYREASTRPALMVVLPVRGVMFQNRGRMPRVCASARAMRGFGTISRWESCDSDRALWVQFPSSSLDDDVRRRETRCAPPRDKAGVSSCFPLQSLGRDVTRTVSDQAQAGHCMAYPSSRGPRTEPGPGPRARPGPRQ